MLGKQIKELRGNESRDSFAERFGKSRNTIMYYETEKRKPDSDFLEALCREYKVSPTWLLLGEGPKNLQSHEVEASVDMINDVIGGDKDAGNRRHAQLKHAGDFLRQSREASPGLGECIELLVKIHNSGDQVLTRAINANLQAFGTALDDRKRADQAIAKLGDLEARLQALEREVQQQRNKSEMEDGGGRQQKAG